GAGTALQVACLGRRAAVPARTAGRSPAFGPVDRRRAGLERRTSRTTRPRERSARDLRAVTEAARDLLGGADERPGRPGQLLGREPIGGPGDGDRGGDLPLGAADRRRRGVQPLLELLDRDGPPPLPRLGELLPQLFDRGHGRCGEALAGAPRAG